MIPAHLKGDLGQGEKKKAGEKWCGVADASRDPRKTYGRSPGGGFNGAAPRKRVPET